MTDRVSVSGRVIGVRTIGIDHQRTVGALNDRPPRANRFRRCPRNRGRNDAGHSNIRTGIANVPTRVRLQYVTADNRGLVSYGVGYRHIHRGRYAEIRQEIHQRRQQPGIRWRRNHYRIVPLRQVAEAGATAVIQADASRCNSHRIRRQRNHFSGHRIHHREIGLEGIRSTQQQQ
ncbi:SD repeat-containing cell surface domain protein [Klebsiella michiganensis]|nr:SD repeat-containing cell surface domain protein [Klebsiella michiganensis]